MIRIALCDDDQPTLERYDSILTETAEKNRLDIRITQYVSGEQLLFQLSNDPNSADIIYLDILMGKMSGLDTAKKLREVGCTAQIIYLTTSDEYVFEAFDVEPFYYIVKDEMPTKKFKEIFLRAVETVRRKASDYISITFGGTVVKIRLDKIPYFEISNRRVTVHTQDGDYDYYSTLDEVEKKLADKDFVRVHRSYLVNCYYIKKLARNQITLLDGTEIPVSTKYSQFVQEQFSKYLLNV